MSVVTTSSRVVLCPQGSTSLSGYQPCSKCPIGYYQPYKGQQVCAKCPEGFSTETEGAIDCTNITALQCDKVTISIDYYGFNLLFTNYTD